MTAFSTQFSVGLSQQFFAVFHSLVLLVPSALPFPAPLFHTLYLSCQFRYISLCPFSSCTCITHLAPSLSLPFLTFPSFSHVPDLSNLSDFLPNRDTANRIKLPHSSTQSRPITHIKQIAPHPSSHTNFQMYIPKHNDAPDWEQQESLIRQYPLATVVTTVDGKLVANHIPFLFHVDKESGKRFLRAHLSRRNHQLPSLDDNGHVLVIFTSPDSYITPSYYPGKEETHKYVPTWDFASLHVYGHSRVLNDAAYIKGQLHGLTNQQEKSRDKPWSVSDAPEKYVDLKIKAISGLEIEILETECKYKFQQDMSSADVGGVVDGLKEDGLHAMAELTVAANEKEGGAKK